MKGFFDAGKPVAAICHGPWTVLEAGAARAGG
ncbi:MAG: DJ-1/PfpI family protein [Caulobacteraceae bacterium]